MPSINPGIDPFSLLYRKDWVLEGIGGKGFCQEQFTIMNETAMCRYDAKGKLTVFHRYLILKRSDDPSEKDEVLTIHDDHYMHICKEMRSNL